MAMSLERMNQKLEKILKDLDSAIEDRDMTNARNQIKKVKDLNKKAEGQANDTILAKLEEKIQMITEEIRNEELEQSEKRDLLKIRKDIIDGKDPFKKTKEVVDSLSEKGVSQEDLKNHKEIQKRDNLFQIQGLEENNKDLAKQISYIEMQYMDKIEQNEGAIEILEELKNQYVLLSSYDPNMDQEAINNTKSNIRGKISELSSTGALYNATIQTLQNFESDPNALGNNNVNHLISIIQNNNQSIVDGIQSDPVMPVAFWNQYKLGEVADVQGFKEKYQEMLGNRQKNTSKIVTLEAENRQIEKTIRTLEREDKLSHIAYNADGTEKDARDIAEQVLSNEAVKRDIERQVNERFDGGFFKRFGARMNYYKETQNAGKFKAFCKAATSLTKSVKQITAVSEAVKTGKGMSNMAINNMTRRQNDFKETLRKEATKQMAKNPKLTEKDVKDDAISKAYESATKGEEER